MRIFIQASLFLLFSVNANAQKLQASNIYLFEMKQLTDSVFTFTNPKFLTGFNKDGYNNQPNFFSNNELFLTVQMSNDTTQTDIYKLDLSNRSLARVTATQESEYSPSIVIEEFEHLQNFYFSCVRVEKDESMRIWQFPLDRTENGWPVIKNLKNIGYYEWFNKDIVATFLVGPPHNITLVDRNTEGTEFITSNVGRCFKKISNKHIAYVHKIGQTFWQLKELEIENGRTLRVIEMPEGSEDFAYLPDGTYLTAKDTKLYKFNKKTDRSWIEIANFSAYRFEKITRIAVSDDLKIAIVVQ